MNCNTDSEEEEDEYVGTPYGEFLESEEAYQEPSRSRWYLRLPTSPCIKFSILKLFGEFICWFLFNFIHFLEIDGFWKLGFILRIEMGVE